MDRKLIHHHQHHHSHIHHYEEDDLYHLVEAESLEQERPSSSPTKIPSMKTDSNSSSSIVINEKYDYDIDRYSLDEHRKKKSCKRKLRALSNGIMTEAEKPKEEATESTNSSECSLSPPSYVDQYEVGSDDDEDNVKTCDQSLENEDMAVFRLSERSSSVITSMRMRLVNKKSKEQNLELEEEQTDIDPRIDDPKVSSLKTSRISKLIHRFRHAPPMSKPRREKQMDQFIVKDDEVEQVPNEKKWWEYTEPTSEKYSAIDASKSIQSLVSLSPSSSSSDEESRRLFQERYHPSNFRENISEDGRLQSQPQSKVKNVKDTPNSPTHSLPISKSNESVYVDKILTKIEKNHQKLNSIMEDSQNSLSPHLAKSSYIYDSLDVEVRRLNSLADFTLEKSSRNTSDGSLSTNSVGELEDFDTALERIKNNYKRTVNILGNTSIESLRQKALGFIRTEDLNDPIAIINKAKSNSKDIFDPLDLTDQSTSTEPDIPENVEDNKTMDIEDLKDIREEEDNYISSDSSSYISVSEARVNGNPQEISRDELPTHEVSVQTSTHLQMLPFTEKKNEHMYIDDSRNKNILSDDVLKQPENTTTAPSDERTCPGEQDSDDVSASKKASVLTEDQRRKYLDMVQNDRLCQLLLRKIETCTQRLAELDRRHPS